MTLQPQANFTVVRQIANHLDTDTNYVRAVIRNALTDDIIDTLNLTDKGSQRFKKDWQVPADTSGMGFYISIVTSVYTDSGYTTKNSNYGDEETTYLVQERVLLGGRGGGGIDAYTVRRIIKEELEKLPEPKEVTIPPFPTIPTYEMRWDEVLGAISAMPTKIAFPEQKEVDLTPVISRLNEAIKSVADKEVTPATDLAPILAKLEAVEAQTHEAHQATTQAIEELPLKVEEVVRSIEMNVAPMTAKATPKKEEPVPFDLKQLSI